MTALRSHQIQMVAFALARPYALWYSGTGSGKTLALLTYLSAFSGLRLVICPKPALHVYKEDCDKFGLNCDIVVLDTGSSKQKQAQLNALADSRQDAIVVVNYETARLLQFNHISFTAVGADEAQKLGAYNSKTSVHLARECAHIPRRVAMTGTPYTDGLRALYGIVRWLNPRLPATRRSHPESKILGSWLDFMTDYCVTYTYNNIRIVSGYKNQADLVDRIKPFTLQIQTEDVIDLPDAVDIIHKCQLSAATQRAYKTLEEHAALDVTEDTSIFAPHILQRIVRLQQMVCSGELTDEDGYTIHFDIRNRENILSQLHEELGSQPYVIFTRFKRDVEIVKNIINAPVALLTGDEDNHQQWRDGKYQVLIANIASGAAGVRLERAAHIVFWSVGYSAMDYLQARGRIRRDGQKSSKVFFHHILAKDTIDETIYNAIQQKLTESRAMDQKL